MKALLSVLILLTTAINGWAQIPNKIGAKPEELAAMAGRMGAALHIQQGFNQCGAHGLWWGG